MSKETPTEKYYNDLMETPVDSLTFEKKTGMMGCIEYILVLDGIGTFTIVDNLDNVRSWFEDVDGESWASIEGLDIRERDGLSVQYTIELIKRMSEF